MKTVFTFTADSITVKGKTFPAEYSVTPSGSVFVFVQEDGKQEKTRIRFNPDHAEYAAALAAARNEQPAPAADERPEIIPAADPAPAAVEETPAAPAADPAPSPTEKRRAAPSRKKPLSAKASPATAGKSFLTAKRAARGSSLKASPRTPPAPPWTRPVSSSPLL